MEVSKEVREGWSLLIVQRWNGWPSVKEERKVTQLSVTL